MVHMQMYRKYTSKHKLNPKPMKMPTPTPF